MIESLKTFILDSIAPPFCSWCKIFLDQRIPLCNQCQQLVKPIVSTSLTYKNSLTMNIYALGLYEGPLQALIRAKNHRNRVASYQLAQLIWEQKAHLIEGYDFLVPIPLHWTRYAYRGFNQAEIMAEYIAQWSRVPTAQMLKRKQYTIFQAQLSAIKRAENVKNVFTLKDVQKSYLGKRILLIDDLMTTGSTLISAAKVLHVLQPAEIDALVGARVL